MQNQGGGSKIKIILTTLTQQIQEKGIITKEITPKGNPKETPKGNPKENINKQ
jgi:hypothetical protein